MARHTLYAYVDGSDLHSIADDLESRFERFVGREAWRFGTPTIVNQRWPDDDPTLRPGDLPDWDLGLNLDLPNPGEEPPGWFSDVERIARFLGELNASLGRDFVIGIVDNEGGYGEDLFFVKSATPDLGNLCKIIGVDVRNA